MIRLLDVNVLLALAWPDHVHHDAAHVWFGFKRQDGWATCPITESSFVRLSSQPAVTKQTVAVRDAIEILRASTKDANHHFWHHTRSITQLPPEVIARLVGPQQITDALLLGLAVDQGGVLATFDKRIESLLPAGSPMRASIEVIPIPGDA